MYSIGQVSEKFNIPISTLRYYDNVGLFPNLKRENGIRKFGENEIESLQVIEVLKASGLEIKDIKQYIDLIQEGPKTYHQRKEIFETRKNKIDEEIKRLTQARDLLEYKCWYYETAIKDGNEDHLNEIIPDKLPEKMKRIYDNFHSS